MKLDADCLVACLDIVGLYESIILSKVLEVVWQKLETDEMFLSIIDWKTDDIMHLFQVT